jgi:hypothetical protein
MHTFVQDIRYSVRMVLNSPSSPLGLVPMVSLRYE